MHNLLLNLTGWITNHPNLAGFVIFASSFAESLAFVGLVIPGAAIMMTTGALIATGSLSFWGTMLWAVCGAVLGDGISYWFGRHFRGNIHSFPLFNRHPEMFDRVEVFFRKHGGKSVFFGRFIGPIRPVIPIVAGMLEMSPIHFTMYNILSALGWAPAYLLPGIAFGASLALAGEVAGRLAVLLVILMLIAWLVFIVFQKIFFVVLSRYPHWEQEIIVFISRSPLMRRWLGGFFDENRSLLGPFILFVLLLCSALWLFLGITEDVVSGDPLVASGTSLYHILQELRTPWGDALMTGITMLGDAVLTVPLVSVIFIWLLWKKDRRSALFLGVTTIGAFLLVTATKEITHIARPVDLYSGASHWSFPSSHATMSFVVFGFVALLCSLGEVGRKRWLPFALAIFSSLIIGFSRLYLGAHWLSDVLGGYSLGLAWLIVMSMVYLRNKKSLLPTGLFKFCLLIFPLTFAIHWGTGFTSSRLRYQPHYRDSQIKTTNWLNTGWQQLPLYRQDLGGEKEQFFNLQYAGSLDSLVTLLQKSGWQKPVPLTIVTSLRWLMSKPSFQDIPILPMVHDGSHDVLLLTHKLPGKTRDFLTIRLWAAHTTLNDSHHIWVGMLTRMTLQQYGKLITLPKTEVVVSSTRLIADLSTASYWPKRTEGKSILLVMNKNLNQ